MFANINYWIGFICTAQTIPTYLTKNSGLINPSEIKPEATVARQTSQSINQSPKREFLISSRYNCSFPLEISALRVVSPEAVLTFEKQQSLNSLDWHFPQQTALRRPIAALTFSVCVGYVGHMVLYSTLKKGTSCLNAVRHTHAPLSTSSGTRRVHTCGVSGPLQKKVTHLGESHSQGFFIKVVTFDLWPF